MVWRWSPPRKRGSVHLRYLFSAFLPGRFARFWASLGKAAVNTVETGRESGKILLLVERFTTKLSRSTHLERCRWRCQVDPMRIPSVHAAKLHSHLTLLRKLKLFVALLCARHALRLLQA